MRRVAVLQLAMMSILDHHVEHPDEAMTHSEVEFLDVVGEALVESDVGRRSGPNRTPDSWDEEF